MLSAPRWTAAAAVAVGGLGALVRHRRPARHRGSGGPDHGGDRARSSPLPPMTTQSSPGQIAELQQAYGAEMAPPSAPAGGEDPGAG